MVYPGKEDLSSWATEYRALPVWKTMEIVREPLETFKILKHLSHQCYILESSDDHKQRGRYTFLGYDPKLEISCTDGALCIKNGAEIHLLVKDPGIRIAQILEENRTPRFPELPPFSGGLVGYFSYDYIKYTEPQLNLDAGDEEKFKDVDLMLFDKVICYDHQENHILLIVNIKTDNLSENYNRALSELDYLEHLLRHGVSAVMPPLKLSTGFFPLFDESRYCAMVERAKNHIREGDIFQVVLSNRLHAEAEGSLFGTYCRLRESNPSPYMFYFSSDDIEIAGAAPETLVKLSGDAVFTYPLAGTRPRGLTPAEDEALATDLLADAKELAEHNMLVDLGRNDIGKISCFGSVQVAEYLNIVRFSHVMHLGSTVTGKLRQDLRALDAIAALLPAGTLSGAPKIRACEIIRELEDNKRGIYGGALGYLSFSGDMDTCIAIRIAFKKNGKVFIRSGAGIVADSVPEKEYAECGAKLQAVVQALSHTEGG
jgi:anthranilate synthase component 1